MKKTPQHLVQDPYLAISKISQVTQYSSYITRFVQKLKWLRSIICRQRMTMRSIRYFLSEFRVQRASFICVRPQGASNCPASGASFVFTIEGSIEQFCERSELWHAVYCLPKWLASKRRRCYSLRYIIRTPVRIIHLNAREGKLVCMIVYYAYRGTYYIA